jgi:hypothetical protein
VKDPCPHCGRPYTVVTRWVRTNDPERPSKVRDVDDHACPSFRTEGPLSPLEQGFTVIPSRTPADLAEAMRRYRRNIK